MKALAKNGKTYRSFDLSTECPKRLSGNPCPYCYVEAARKAGFRGKTSCLRVPYEGEILKLRKSTIERLNRCGGLRFFAFSDYMEWMDEDLMRAIEDSRKVGLLIKAITKVPEFVEKYHQYFRIINVSIDSLGHGMNWEDAKSLRKSYKNVLVRSAVMSWEDVDALGWTDILTLNHGPNGFYHFKRKEKEDLVEKYGYKMCCVTGRCETCTLKCGSPRL